jgi:hypothetical protein
MRFPAVGRRYTSPVFCSALIYHTCGFLSSETLVPQRVAHSACKRCGASHSAGRVWHGWVGGSFQSQCLLRWKEMRRTCDPIYVGSPWPGPLETRWLLGVSRPPRSPRPRRSLVRVARGGDWWYTGRVQRSFGCAPQVTTDAPQRPNRSRCPAWPWRVPLPPGEGSARAEGVRERAQEVMSEIPLAFSFGSELLSRDCEPDHVDTVAHHLHTRLTRYAELADHRWSHSDCRQSLLAHWLGGRRAQHIE